MTESCAPAPLVWFTSSHSNGAGGECVECALVTGGTLIRDSKRMGGPVITVGHGAWHSFIRPLKERLSIEESC
ncbi:DUF397 domain-containing protein [Streptomyces resistomycificus]|uniref:DUF397 domain-containing protein n=1 Tax=Streptomyces resistomycificus TaxID=67356 RepID=A0A0L8LEF5_9ACTN|nr:DUF397 domain-containing protein [Streptomyces resistomycificus]KOG36494.1 hypothetical protein ADK37_13835 [Streptomyces resistomycificus]KUN92491.1 hypothetical protein AQJ84_33570 [Streptomyces resistomycificus]